MTPDKISAHYERVGDVYRALATVDGNPTIGNNDFVGWYIKRDHDDVDAIEDGYPRKGRVAQLDADLETLLSRLNRTLYAITTYKDPEAFDRWVPCRYDEEDERTEWREENPTPRAEDLRAVPAWGDIDLRDELKEQRGSLDPDTQETVERTLEAYIDEFVDLYGSADAVYALDSVGGAYIFGAPEATLPIARHFQDDEARAWIFDELIDRMNDWLARAEERVNQRVDGAAEVIQPDWVQNLNRQYKAPLSIHKNIDAVVTPIDTDTVSYDLTLIEDVDESLIDAGERWARELTAVEHEETVETLVSTLWPDESADADGWRETLETWVDAERERRREAEERRHRARERREQRESEIGEIEGLPIAPEIEDIEEAIDDLNIKKVAEDTIVDEWNDDANTSAGAKAFYPDWDPDCAGTANIVVPSKGIAVDTGDGNAKGGAVEMALYNAEDWTWGDTADGEDWWKGVEELRNLGYEIPVFTPDAKSADGDKMPFWAVKKAAVALGVLSADEFVEQGADNEDSYEGFPDRETYHRALEAIEDAGLDHGREQDEQREARETVVDLIEKYENVEDINTEEGPSRREWDRLYDAIGKLTDDTYIEHSDELSNIFETAAARLDRHRALYQYETEEGPILVEDKQTKLITGTLRRTEPILNFGLEVDSYLSMEHGSMMANVHITPSEPSESNFYKQIEPKVFNTPQRFKDEILAERFSTAIEADEDDEDILDTLRKYISRQEAPERFGTRQMGLARGEFVTPNGSIGTSGWEEEPQTVFVERDTGAESKFELSPDEHPDYDADEVADMIELLVNTRDPERFLPVLGWFYAAPFRPYIFEKTGNMNLLSVKGASGSGKTTTLATLWELFGMGTEPFSCTDTRFVLLSTLAASNSVPMWFDEYKPSDMQDWMVNRLHEHLRKAATGGIVQRGNADQTTEEYALRAPAVVSGEEGMIGSAEQRRAIITTFREGPTEAETETAKNLKQLVGESWVEDGTVQFEESQYELPTHALAYYEYVVDYDEDEFAEAWRSAKRYVEKRLQEWGVASDLDDLERQGLQTIVFGYNQLREFALGLGAAESELPSTEDLRAALKVVADVDGTGRESHIDRYVQLLARVALADELTEDKHYTMVREGEPEEELRVNISRAHDKITKYARDHDISEDILSTASDYRDRFAEVEAEDDTYVTTTGQNSPPISRAVGIDMRRADEELPDFDRSVFVDEQDDEAEDASSDDEDGLPTPEVIAIGEIDTHQQISIIGEVSFGQWDGRSTGDGPAWAATLSDRTGEARLVAWDEEQVPDMYDAQGRFEPDALMVKNAKVGSMYEGDQQLIIDEKTEIEPAQLGAGSTSMAETENDEQLDDAAADGGAVVQVKETVQELLRDKRIDEPITVASVAEKIEAAPDEVEHALESLANQPQPMITGAGEEDREYRYV